MSSEHRRRYEDAVTAIRQTYFDPLNDFADAAKSWIEDAERRAVAAEVVLEQMRPVWAQGFTSDSEAAQANGNALSELWGLLYAKDQTQAMTNLRRLIAAAGQAESAAALAYHQGERDGVSRSRNRPGDGDMGG